VTASKLIRAALGVAVVIVLGIVVMNWWGDFRSAGSFKPTTTVTTPTGGASTSTTEAVSGIAIVKIDGVNFRTKPSSSAKLIRGLKKGEEVTVVLKDGQWYKVEDSKGKTGWVTANGDYVTLQGQ
jgi:peptidoglycan DL-endopeptidase CwlO